MWLALSTNRDLIIPNLLGHEEWTNGGRYKGQAMWPGFRVAKLKRAEGRTSIKIEILEPAYYWRVHRDYDDAPAPRVVLFDPKRDDLRTIKDMVTSQGDVPRIVLQGVNADSDASEQSDAKRRAVVWASDSVGWFEQPFSSEQLRYKFLPSVKRLGRNVQHVSDILDGLRNCQNIFGSPKGNASCFQICE